MGLNNTEFGIDTYTYTNTMNNVVGVGQVAIGAFAKTSNTAIGSIAIGYSSCATLPKVIAFAPGITCINDNPTEDDVGKLSGYVRVEVNEKLYYMPLYYGQQPQL